MSEAEGVVAFMDEGDLHRGCTGPDVPDCLDTTSEDKLWKFFGSSTPKGQIIFIAQVIIIYVVIIVSILNLSLENGDSNLWSALLCSCLGYLLPSPSLKKDKK